MTTTAVVMFDGETRPDDPGPSAIGDIVETDDWTEEGSKHIGESTNNRTEYRALIQGLELASRQGCTKVEARGDPEVIVKQVRGVYGVNQPELRPLRNRVQELADEFEKFEIQYIPREENWEADELVDQAFSE
ncbi:ribonuclease HI family protein [Halopenitus sp. POP-27]|uniref:ribonuclease HI family protein n=1 Tax=Halopenitus sp. POP-27 TaxID=2994425 RepID=UPI00246958E5|nr:ribonuclease HI family protein [Halopenitus sp. POP-27]